MHTKKHQERQIPTGFSKGDDKHFENKRCSLEFEQCEGNDTAEETSSSDTSSKQDFEEEVASVPDCEGMIRKSRRAFLNSKK